MVGVILVEETYILKLIMVVIQVVFPLSLQGSLMLLDAHTAINLIAINHLNT